MFRAKDLEEGNEIKGGYIHYANAHFIFIKSSKKFLSRFIKIDPTTLAMQTGIKDKDGVEIYGSYSVDGIKSEGGDWVRIMCDESHIDFQINWLKENQWCGWEIGSRDEIEIIGDKK